MAGISLLNFHKNPFLGILGRANDDWLIVAKGVPKEALRRAKETLEVDVIETTIGGTSLIGSLLIINSHGIIVSNIAYEDELKLLKETGLEVEVVPGKENAVGNLVLIDDVAAIVDPELEDETVRLIEEVMKVKVYRGTIGDSGLTGMSAVVNKYGVLCHPDLSDKEEEILKIAFGKDRDINIGTVNKGTPFVGSGIIANSKGVIVGDKSTGVELMRIETTLLP